MSRPSVWSELSPRRWRLTTVALAEKHFPSAAATERSRAGTSHDGAFLLLGRRPAIACQSLLIAPCLDRVGHSTAWIAVPLALHGLFFLVVAMEACGVGRMHPGGGDVAVPLSLIGEPSLSLDIPPDNVVRIINRPLPLRHDGFGRPARPGSREHNWI